jgi:signal transduction histidine kinase
MNDTTSIEDMPAGRSRWTAIALASVVPAAIDVAHDLTRGRSTSPACVACNLVGSFIALSALTELFEASRRRHLEAALTFGVLAATTLVVALLELGLGAAVQILTGLDVVGDLARLRSPGVVATSVTFDGVMTLGLWAAAIGLPFAVRDANLRALEADRLRTAAELARLRAHLQPHFLLNTLNTIAGLVGQDPDEARRLLGGLGDLLRESAEEGDEMQTLDKEIAWLRRYADILETRHRGALSFRWEIGEETRLTRVPRLLLQPLLENAVKHGALRRRGGGEVCVTIGREPDGRVRCVVSDNGPGPAERTRPGALGLALVTRRLAARYAGRAVFRLEAADGVTRSIVELPFEAAT